jgi:hypothetical protein
VRRTRVYIAVGFAVFVFVGLSLLLARGLSGASVERGKVLDLLRDQAAGDAPAMLEQMPACRAQRACVIATEERARSQQRPGRVEILTYTPSTQLALTRQIGTGRVAWRAGTARPVVQCVRVLREGPLTGARVELLSLSDPIDNEGSCPG